MSWNPWVSVPQKRCAGETACRSLGLGHPGREMPMSTQHADDSREVESAGHRHARDISGSPSVTGDTEADSVGWPSLSNTHSHCLAFSY